MKALSVWQPWASLIAHQIKHHETRGWAPPKSIIGKDLAICASKSQVGLRHFAGGQRDDPRTVALETMAADGQPISALPLGAVVAVVRVTGAIACDSVRPGDIDERQLALGDWSHGRWAWTLNYVVRLLNPVPVRGRQGLFDLLPETAQQVREAVGSC